MSSERGPWILTIPSNLRQLSMARAFVEEICRIAGLEQAVIDSIVLATDEATNNIMRHAHHGRPDALLQIRCFLNADAVEIHLLDEGQPFDLGAVPHLNPGELRVGGRGVFLMRSIMDELTCSPRGELGNTLRMVKRAPVRICS